MWPEEPEDFGPWNKQELEDLEVLQKAQQEELASTGDARVNQERRERMREQARDLLEGRVRWRAGDDRKGGVLVSR